MKKTYIKIVHGEDDYNNWFVVNWCLGNTCNYSCSYCPDNLHNGSRRWPELDNIKQFILKVKTQHPSKKLYFDFTGGEVTLYKNFIELCEFCKEQDVRVGMISNGSRTLRWWEEHAHLFDHVCLSYHPEEANADHYLAVAKILENKFRLHLNIMMSPDKFDQCYSVAERATTLENTSIALQPLIVDFGEVLFEYTDAQKKIMENQWELIGSKIKWTKHMENYRGVMKLIYPNDTSLKVPPHELIARGKNHWAGWDCYAGVEQLIVDLDGSIHRGWCKVGGKIGSIYDEFINFPTAPVRCNKLMCHCNFDIMSTKVWPNN
jgi:organic radical activating enzyme